MILSTFDTHESIDVPSTFESIDIPSAGHLLLFFVGPSCVVVILPVVSPSWPGWCSILGGVFAWKSLHPARARHQR